MQAEARLEAEFQLQQGIRSWSSSITSRRAPLPSSPRSGAPWPDLQQALTLAGMDGTEDAVNHPGIVQEVLAEALARAVLVKLGHWKRFQAAGPRPRREARMRKGAILTAKRRAGRAKRWPTAVSSGWPPSGSSGFRGDLQAAAIDARRCRPGSRAVPCRREVRMIGRPRVTFTAAPKPLYEQGRLVVVSPAPRRNAPGAWE